MADFSLRVPTTGLRKPAQFSIAFGRRRRMVGVLRRFVADFYDQIVRAEAPPRPCSAWASRLSLAAHELVENVLRYSPEGDAEFSIEIEPDPTGPEGAHIVHMMTRNRAHPEQRERVRQRVEELQSAEDPFAFYISLMSESARRAEGSGLGLARVRVEADMEIRCRIDGEDLEVFAEARIQSDVDRVEETVR